MRLTKYAVVLAAAALAVPCWSTRAWAGPDHRHHAGHDDWRPHGHVFIHHLPRGYGRFHFHDHDYFFHRGHFYAPARGGFILVNAPIGAVVATLPLGYVAVHIGGIRYFTFGGVYYRPAPAGYEIVQVPVPVPASVPAPQPQPVATASQTVTVQAAQLNVRSGPGKTFSIVGQVSQGAQLAVHGDAPGWYYVQLPNGQFGWVTTRFAAPFVSDAKG